MISLNVCCNPNPTPTSKAAEPAINTVNLTPMDSYYPYYISNDLK